MAGGIILQVAREDTANGFAVRGMQDEATGADRPGRDRRRAGMPVA